jgi:hypothetical protein
MENRNKSISSNWFCTKHLARVIEKFTVVEIDHVGQSEPMDGKESQILKLYHRTLLCNIAHESTRKQRSITSPIERYPIDWTLQLLSPLNSRLIRRPVLFMATNKHPVPSIRGSGDVAALWGA